jgi:hypothetical protein
MEKHSVFAGGVILLVGIIAFQTMRADAVPGASQAQTISPIDMMQTARDLPAERVDKPF